MICEYLMPMMGYENESKYFSMCNLGSWEALWGIKLWIFDAVGVTKMNRNISACVFFVIKHCEEFTGDVYIEL